MSVSACQKVDVYLAIGQPGMTIACPSPSELRTECHAMGRGVPFAVGNRNRTSCAMGFLRRAFRLAGNRIRDVTQWVRGVSLRRRKWELNVVEWVQACPSPPETGTECHAMGRRRAFRCRKQDPNAARWVQACPSLSETEAERHAMSSGVPFAVGKGI
ncbi:MAG: hypothetical protein U5K84_13880 [Alkalibacterium sp.]|nr:hypothetical protein [Alkalibacterium sp.]